MFSMPTTAFFCFCGVHDNYSNIERLVVYHLAFCYVRYRLALYFLHTSFWITVFSMPLVLYYQSQHLSLLLVSALTFYFYKICAAGFSTTNASLLFGYLFFSVFIFSCFNVQLLLFLILYPFKVSSLESICVLYLVLFGWFFYISFWICSY